MSEVHLVAGDDDGGPHLHATITVERDAESLEDSEVAEMRDRARDLFTRSFGESPQSVIVYVKD